MSKTLKRTVSILLSLIMVLSVFAIVPITASAASTGSFGSLTWNIDDDGTLTFSGSGAIPKEAFEKNGDVKKVIINDSVTELGAYAFYSCPNLTEVDIQNPSVSLKGSHHFAITGVTTVTLPEGMTKIPQGMFRYCTALTTVDLPSTITSIADVAFEGSGLQSISVPEGATYVSDSFKTNSLQSLTLEGSSPMTFTGGGFTFLSDAATVFIPEGSTYVYSNTTATLYVKDPSNEDAQELLEDAQEDLNEYIEEYGYTPEEALAEVNGDYFGEDIYGMNVTTEGPFTVTLNEGDKCEAVFGGATIGKYVPAPEPARTYKVVVYDPWAYNTKTYTEAATVPFVITGTELIQSMGLDPEYTVTSVTLSSGSNVSVSGTNITINDIGTSNVSIGLKEQTSSYVMSFSRDFEITVTTTYSITWLNEDGTAFDTTSVTSGTSPSHAGPTKDADDDYTYTFSGWTDGENTYAPNALPAATDDATYTAVFTPVQKYETGYYIIGTFTGEDGWKIDPAYKLSENTETEGEYYYHNLALTTEDAFKVIYVEPGVRTWYPDNAADYTVSDDGKYDVYFRPDYQGGQDWYYGCIFTEKAKFTVTWKNDDGSVIDTTTVVYGDTPTHDDAAKNENEYYTFTFAGWTPEITAVTGNATYTATYNHTAKQEDGLIKRFTFDYIDEVNEMTYINAASGAKWAWSKHHPQYDYSAYAPEGGAFVYTYSFIDYRGAYQADNWMITPAIEIPEYVTHMTFYATNANKNYPEKFDVCVGSSADPSSMTVIQTVKPTTNGAYDPWNFYDIDLTAYAGQTIYVGFHDTCYDQYEAWLDLIEFRYTDEPAFFNVTWNNEDGSVIDTTKVLRDTVPTHDDPTKDADARYSYTFAGWTPEPVAVDGDAEYTATFAPHLTPVEIEIKNNTIYVDGARYSLYKLVLTTDGDYYYVNDGYKIAKNKRIYLSANAVKGTDLTPGYYFFGEDGKMTIANGPMSDGYFYINNVAQKAYQLVEFEGAYYYLNDGGKYVKNGSAYLSAKTLEGTGLVAGWFSFDADGKMIIKNGAWSDGYFYLGGVKQTAYKTLVYQGKVYYITDGHKYAKSARVYLGKNTAAMVGLNPGFYDFGADGAIIGIEILAT